jgi:hypothetical protein
VENKYPVLNTFSAENKNLCGNFKINNTFNFRKEFSAQLTAIYLAPDIHSSEIKSMIFRFGSKKIQKER